MFSEIYYEHYAENCRKNYWDLEEKSIPYLVSFSNFNERNQFMVFLNEQGFQCVNNSDSYKAILVNLQLKRYAVITKACKQLCVGYRTYSPDEFMKEVYELWQK